jgi:16S rRNA (cytidine1402-2'-O)-methyltransferase
MSGQPTRRFAFEAFLPRDKKERAKVLEELKTETRTIVLYEAPHHLIATLEQLREALGNRCVSVCRELTKKYEDIQKTTLDDVLIYYKDHEPRGEYVLVLEGISREVLEEEQKKGWQELSFSEHMAVYESQGIPRKEAMKRVAVDRGISKREVYQALLAEDS